MSKSVGCKVEMSPNRRIVLNIIATYGRSLFALACGLFSGRWVLMALGEIDYGLFGVVGGLTGFIAFFNNVLAYSMARFYATAIGKAARISQEGNESEGLEECRKWFSIALLIHTIIPIVLMAIGYPIGVWAVRNFLTIPPEKIATCVWVFRVVCLSCFLGMVSVPFNAMYTAKQYIAELTIYSIVTTALNLCFLYYMVSNIGEWLLVYAIWTCILVIAPQVIIAVRACMIFPECRFRFRYASDVPRIRELFSYTGWQMFGSLGSLLRTQGMQVLVNKYHGPAVNSAMSIATTVNTHASSLATSMIVAFQPAISTAFGAGDMGRLKSLSNRACKFGMLCALIFVLPLSVELPEVIRLWLKNPPLFTIELCYCMMIVAFLNMAAIGQDMSVNASGRIATYQITIGGTMILTLPLAWMFSAMGLGPVWIGYANIIMMAITLVRVFFARAILGISISHWAFKIVMPVILVSLVSGFLGFCTRFYLEASFFRVIITTAIVEVSLVSFTWLIVLDPTERIICMERFAQFVRKCYRFGHEGK